MSKLILLMQKLLCIRVLYFQHHTSFLCTIILALTKNNFDIITTYVWHTSKFIFSFNYLSRVMIETLSIVLWVSWSLVRVDIIMEVNFNVSVTTHLSHQEGKYTYKKCMHESRDANKPSFLLCLNSVRL